MLCLMIGDYYFEWNENDLCLPQSIKNLDPIFCFEIEDKINFKNISELICEWNVNKISINKININTNLEFIESILKILNITLFKSIDELIKNVKNRKTSDIEFKMTNEFIKKFKIKDRTSLIFKTHQELDIFIENLILMDKDFNIHFKEEYLFLKSIDNSYWMRDNYLSDEIQYQSQTLDLLIKDYLFKNLENKDEIQKNPNEVKLVEKNLWSLKMERMNTISNQSNPKHGSLKIIEKCPFHVQKF